MRPGDELSVVPLVYSNWLMLYNTRLVVSTTDSVFEKHIVSLLVGTSRGRVLGNLQTGGR